MRVVPAADGTGIGATGWDGKQIAFYSRKHNLSVWIDLKKIRLYYQGVDGGLYELSGSFDTGKL